MKTEVAIIGGGPAGATSAIFLLRQGIRPLIIEKESFPRYHIGESMTGGYHPERAPLWEEHALAWAG